MITGSCNFFNFQGKLITATAIKAVGISMIERLAMTMTEPVMAPIAAAVIPSRKATTPGRLQYFFKYGAGIMVNHKGQHGQRGAQDAIVHITQIDRGFEAHHVMRCDVFKLVLACTQRGVRLGSQYLGSRSKCESYGYAVFSAKFRAPFQRRPFEENSSWPDTSHSSDPKSVDRF